MVVAFWSPGAVASFDVGSIAQGVPLVERVPGHYVGEFVPLASDSFRDAFVVVSLKDKYGRRTAQKLGRMAVSYK